MLGKDRAKKLAKLQTPKGRRESGQMLLDAPALVAEGLLRGLLTELFVAEGLEHELVDRARDAGVAVTPAADHQLEKLADLKTCAGLVALASLPRPIELAAALAAGPRYLVFCDRVADPGNLGTIARSAAAFGCDLLVLSEDCADPFSSKALRASAGALLRLAIAEGFPAPGLPWPGLHRAVVVGGEDLDRVERPERLALWLGNEAQGPRAVPPGLACRDVTIAMDSATESLNVAAAAAILLHHFRLRGRSRP